MADITSIKMLVGEKEVELTGDEWREVYLRLNEMYGSNPVYIPPVQPNPWYFTEIQQPYVTWIGEPIPSTGTYTSQ